MRNKVAALALVDLLVTVATIVLLAGVAVPSLTRVRELSQRAVCGVNLSGTGAAGESYSTSNKGSWMVPAFKRGTIDNGGIDYLAGSFRTTAPTVPGEVGYDRTRETTTEPPQGPPNASAIASVTRAYWMLVRSGDITVKQFICPSNQSDVADPTENIDLYYDFTSYSNISYGYQVPFGPQSTQAREGMENRKIIAADKGPFYYDTFYFVTFENSGKNPEGISTEDSPKEWHPFNSPNHGGWFRGEGENVLFGDGHVSFVRIPASGIDNDNIYTVIDGQNWDNNQPSGMNRIWGNLPHALADRGGGPYPGQNAFGVGPGRYSTTDSLIYP